MSHSFFDFFAGGGMARLGLGPDWTCLLANDIDPKKMETYRANFGEAGTVLGDIAKLKAKSMQGKPDLAWASFPCQDLSLAGNRVGLDGERSGAFWGFWSAINKLKLDGRAPTVLVLENVCGLLTSHRGQDFLDLCRALASLGYDFGAVVVDAIDFLPQSRPRLFVICVRNNGRVSREYVGLAADHRWHSAALRAVVDSMPQDLRARWIWWKLPAVSAEIDDVSEILEVDGKQPSWNSQEETARLLNMMSPVNKRKIDEAKSSNRPIVGTGYKRTRVEGSKRIQRFEVRFDGVAGCLRTPGGGSSRQIVVAVKGGIVRTRLLTVREAARLMGVPESYQLPDSYNEGYHIFGDGLAVPAVAFLERNLLRPLISTKIGLNAKAA